eukprot:654394-Prorocentrum_minimum.AAC.1
MLGEMRPTRGSAEAVGQVAYVPQTAWILNATLRDNILFGKAYDAGRYFAAIKAAQLERDVEILPGGHDTEM